jgi:LDH2 family malate/lactate/ureidoglycolate dehydrogenase
MAMGVTDGQEATNGTNPLNLRYMSGTDGQEATNGTNPLSILMAME